MINNPLSAEICAKARLPRLTREMRVAGGEVFPDRRVAVHETAMGSHHGSVRKNQNLYPERTHGDSPSSRLVSGGECYRRPTFRPKTNFSVGVVGSVVVPSCAVPASLLTAGIAKYWKVMVVSPGPEPGSTSKIEYP
jgi:hypothetical protein